MPTLKLDKAFKLNISGIHEGHSFEILFERYEDDETTPEDWPDAIYEFGIGDKEEGGPNKILFTEADGLTVAGNDITVLCLADDNTLTGGLKYFYDLNSDFGGGITNKEGMGSIVVTKSVTR